MSSKGLNIYDLTRDWWNFAFENPEKIKPIHTAVFMFAIEHCNRLAWKDKFGLPTTMAMEAIGVKSYKTYIAALNDLIEWGFIKMIKKSRNQHSSNIIALVKNAKAHTKALDKAMQKHSAKQVQSTDQLNVSIDIPITNLPNTNLPAPAQPEPSVQGELELPDVYPFDSFWDDYAKKRNRNECERLWGKLSDTDKQSIKAHIPKYKEATPDPKYRKDPERYIKHQAWNDEVFVSTPTNSRVKPNWDYTKLPQWKLYSKQPITSRLVVALADFCGYSRDLIEGSFGLDHKWEHKNGTTIISCRETGEIIPEEWPKYIAEKYFWPENAERGKKQFTEHQA